MITKKLVNVELTNDEVKRALVLLMREQAISTNSTKLETYANHLESTSEHGWLFEFSENGKNEWVVSMDGELPDE